MPKQVCPVKLQMMTYRQELQKIWARPRMADEEIYALDFRCAKVSGRSSRPEDLWQKAGDDLVCRYRFEQTMRLSEG